MKKLTQEQINKILEGHKHWLNEDCKGWETMMADFSSCDLHDAYLHDAYLHGANLRGAYLRDAYLHGANLSGANLSGADLHGADLHGGNLSGANLSGANLHYADLSGANLSGAYLRDAYLHGADLSGADLSGAKEVPYIPMVCPEEGVFNGWKKAGDKIVKLRIPEDALRSSATTRKCRCNKAEVVEIYNIDGTIANERIVNSSYDSSFTYEVGETVEVQDFDTNRWNECTRGIHFFINRQEAINY